MKLADLVDKNWNHWEKQRFLNDDTKTSTDAFDAEAFKHDGFEDTEKYLEEYAPALADESRLEAELNNFTPPRLSDINNSPYQALVIRYGVLRTLVRQHDYQMEKSDLLDQVKSWQQEIIAEFDEGAFPEEDSLLHLAQAAIEYQNDIDDAELHLIREFMKVSNKSATWKHQHATWLDIFQRLSSINRFPKVSRSEKPSHAIDTIEQGLWSLQEQAIVYEIVHPEEGNIVGIPEDYVDFVRDWLHYEIEEDNYLQMLEELAPFRHRDTLLKARETFGIERSNQGLNEKRRENIVKEGIFPSDLFREVVEKDQLKEIVDEYDLDAHKRRTNEMIEAIIEFFEQSQTVVDDGEPAAQLYLKCYGDIADGSIDRVPPQLHRLVENESRSEKLEILFEQGTAEIFEDIFNLDGTNLLGQMSSGTVADGEIEQDGKWLLWDNKRRKDEFKLGASTRATIKSYIDTKNQQHSVEWFLVIAPEFAKSADRSALDLEKETGVDIRLVPAREFRRLAIFWQDNLAPGNRELPLHTVFTGSGLFELDEVKGLLEKQFS